MSRAVRCYEVDSMTGSFRAAFWATGTQLVRFSTGASEMIDQQPDSDIDGSEPIMVKKSGFDPEADDPSETVESAPVEPIHGC